MIVKSSRRFVWSSTDDPPDVVHGDVGGVDEGDGDAGGVEAGEVEPDQEVAARVHLDGADLRDKDIYIIYSIFRYLDI